MSTAIVTVITALGLGTFLLLIWAARQDGRDELVALGHVTHPRHPAEGPRRAGGPPAPERELARRS